MESLSLLAAQIYSVFLLILGISHIVRPREWTDFIKAFKGNSFIGLTFAMIALPFGAFMVLTHQIWAYTPTVFITIAAWSLFIKAIIYMLFPGWWPKKLIPSTIKGLNKMNKMWGYIITLIAGIMIYYTFIQPSDVYFEHLRVLF